FFVLLIISHFVVFSADGQDAMEDVSNTEPSLAVGVHVHKSVPSLDLPDDAMEGAVKYCGVVLAFEGPSIVGGGAGGLRRIDSAIVLAFLQNMDSNSIQAGWGLFCRVREMKIGYQEEIQLLKRSIEDCSHQALRYEFRWGSQLVVPEPPESPEVLYAKNNGEEFLRVLVVRYLISKNSAENYLKPNVNLPNFTIKLDSTIEYCKGLMKEIAELENKLRGMPVSPVGSSNPKPWPGSTSLDDF
ncbi:MAG: hypothetical protein WCN27_05305, partial [Alphaproteobacteria bacterium]